MWKDIEVPKLVHPYLRYVRYVGCHGRLGVLGPSKSVFVYDELQEATRACSFSLSRPFFPEVWFYLTAILAAQLLFLK
jgi:hypothetical protein